MIDIAENARAHSRGQAAGTLAWRMGETLHRSPLRWRAAMHGYGDVWTLLALAVSRGCRHLAGISPATVPHDPGREEISDEELVGLLLGGGNTFEPFLLRAAGELLQAASIDPRRLAAVARRERCERVLAYIARIGLDRDPAGKEFWQDLLERLGPQRAVERGMLPHWSRFVAMHGVGRDGRSLGVRWIGARP